MSGRPTTPGQASRLALVLVLGLLGATLLACRNKPSGPASPPVHARIANPRCISAGAVIIAHGKGLWKGDQAKVSLLPFDSGKEALTEMLAGRCELAVVAETPIAKAILESAPVIVLASIHQSNRDVAMVARRDRGIMAPSDLRGRVIGFTRGTSAHYFMDCVLRMNRIRPQEVRLIDLPPLQLRQALLEGRVDAVSTWEPHVAFLSEAIGSQAQIIRDDLIYTQTFCLVARPEFVQHHPQVVKGILEGLVAATAFISRSPLEARFMVASYLQVPPSLLSSSFVATEFDIRLDQALVLSLDSECRWFLEEEASQPRRAPDVLSHLYLPGLVEVRPQAVQVIGATDGRRP